jgi:hypothetical protein
VTPKASEEFHRGHFKGEIKVWNHYLMSPNRYESNDVTVSLAQLA